jgi:hypothetical protein
VSRLLIGEHLAEKNRDFIDNLFNYALVLLGILSAAELEYAMRVSQSVLDMNLIFRVTVTPFIILIPTWFIKELYKQEMSRRRRMFFTEFCWEYFSFTLFSYVILLYAMQTSKWVIIILGALFGFGLSITFIFAIIRAYAQTYRNGPYQDMDEFYHRSRYTWLRYILILAAYALVYLVVL